MLLPVLPLVAPVVLPTTMAPRLAHMRADSLTVSVATANLLFDNSDHDGSKQDVRTSSSAAHLRQRPLSTCKGTESYALLSNGVPPIAYLGPLLSVIIKGVQDPKLV